MACHWAVNVVLCHLVKSNYGEMERWRNGEEFKVYLKITSPN